MLLVPSKGEVILPCRSMNGHLGVGWQKPTEHASWQTLDSPSAPHASPRLPMPGTHFLGDPASHPTLCGPVIPTWWSLAQGAYLHSPKKLILDVAAPKLLLHCGPCGCVQHLQPYLEGRS